MGEFGGSKKIKSPVADAAGNHALFERMIIMNAINVSLSCNND
jgi:hypothetical protein